MLSSEYSGTESLTSSQAKLKQEEEEAKAAIPVKPDTQYTPSKCNSETNKKKSINVVLDGVNSDEDVRNLFLPLATFKKDKRYNKLQEYGKFMAKPESVISSQHAPTYKSSMVPDI